MSDEYVKINDYIGNVGRMPCLISNAQTVWLLYKWVCEILSSGLLQQLTGKSSEFK